MTEKIRNVKSYQIILAIVLLAVVLIGVVYSNSKVVAKVNGESITKDELYAFLVRQGGQQALESLIVDKIIYLEAEKQNIKISQEDIDKEIEQIIAQYGDEEAFTQTMEMYGYSLEDVKKDIEMNLKIEALLEPDISISEQEMKDYFEENKETFAVGEQVKASHILVESKETAEEVKEKLSAGEDYAEMAKEYSIDTTTKEQGGALGFIKKGETVSEFENAAFSLEVGSISEPVKTASGYHIIKVEEKKEAEEANYEESKDQIKEILFDEKIPTVFNTWIQEKYDEYEIKNYL